MATNPAVSMPDAAFARGDGALPHGGGVRSDCRYRYHAAGAYPLPAHAWGEKDGTVTNSERRISRQRAAARPWRGKADWWIMGQVAARLGWGDAFAYDRPAQIWREYAAMTALSARRGKALDLTDKAALDDAAYDALEPFQWGGAYPMGGRAMRLVAVKPAPAPAPDPPFRCGSTPGATATSGTR
jgi:assimilatory nitrate reductase catalytic subunit